MSFVNLSDVTTPSSVPSVCHPLAIPPSLDRPITTPARSLLILDAAVNDVAGLIASAQPGTAVYQLNRQQDGIAQITALLAGTSAIDSIQIISHGRSGGMQLGASWLDLQTLPSYVAQLKTWSAALTADADILLYGCNVAQDTGGQAFVQAFAEITGADIAASDDLTGNAALGGDWDLEVQTGAISPTAGIRAEALHQYQFTLGLQAPVLVKNTFPNVPQAGTIAITNAMLRATDADNTAAEIVYRLNSLPTQGQLRLNGTAIALNGSFTQDDIDQNRVTYVHSGNAAAVTFDFTVSDSLALSPGLVSIGINNTAANARSDNASISSDGRYVVFESTATNLVVGDTNGVTDVFVYDRQTLTTKRVSVNSNGIEANGISDRASISADGRYIAFSSSASNLVSNDTNTRTDVFVHDQLLGTTARISVSSSGLQAASGTLYNSDISADGRYVVFESQTTNWGLGASIYNDIYVHDRQTSTTSKLALLSVGTHNSYVNDAKISNDGRYVVFSSFATNLVSGDTNGTLDIFLHDRQTGTTSRVSVSSSGVQGIGGDSQGGVISSDGRYAVFASLANNLVANDTNNSKDIFVRDLQNGTTTRVSIGTGGIQGNSTSYNPTISPDGNYIAFSSGASNLVSGDTNSYPDVFIHNRQTNQTEKISFNQNGSQLPTGATTGIGYDGISADGRYVIANSWDSVVAEDTNAVPDVYTYDSKQVKATANIAITVGNTAPVIPSDGAVSGNIFVTANQTIQEYSPIGTLIRSIPIPSNNETSGYARDLIIDDQGRFHVYNGTFSPILSTYTPATNTWSSRTLAEWSTANNTSYGGIDYYQNFVFVTDMNTGGGAAKGIVRFNLTDGTSTRFASGVSEEFRDLTIGLDGNLYALGNYGPVYVYNPVTLAFIKSINLSFVDHRGIAVDENGDIFTADWNGNVNYFTPTGQLVRSTAAGGTSLNDINIVNGQLWMGDRNGKVITTDTSFSSFSSWNSSGTNGVFVGKARGLQLNPIDEDATAPIGAVGTKIADLVDLSSIAGGRNNVIDPDANAQLGIAITNLYTTVGTWFYSPDDGNTWNAIGPVSYTNALLLKADATTRLYFQPVLNFNGTVKDAIRFQAWDQTAGTAGGFMNAQVNGGISSLSNAPATASIRINPVDDAPTIFSSNTPLTYTESTASIPIVSTAVLQDPDSTNFDGHTLTIKAIAGNSEADRFGFNFSTANRDGRLLKYNTTTIGSYTGGRSGEPLVVSFNANATLPAVQTIVRGLTYNQFSEKLPANSNVTAELTFKTPTGTISTFTRQINLIGQADAPTIGTTTTLYDPTLGTTPDAQGATAVITGATQTLPAGAVELNSMATTNLKVGYSWIAPRNLDTTTGFNLQFTAQILDEAFNGTQDRNVDGKTDRAGFSLLIISNTSATTGFRGLELAFQPDRIWAQDDGAFQNIPSLQADPTNPDRLLFTQSEGVSYNTTQATQYDLFVQSGEYILSANGQVIMHGRTRGYGVTPPYNVPNTIFFGDNTTAASTKFQLGKVSLTPIDVLPNSTIDEGQAWQLKTTAIDVDTATPLSYRLLNAPVGAAIDAQGKLSWTPTEAQGGAAYTFDVAVSDGALETSRPITVTVNEVNNAPGLTLSNPIASIPEGANPASIKVADITIVDDAAGTNTLAIGGADAASFEIVGTALYLKANSNPDFETKQNYNVTITVDDAAIGTTFEGSQAFNLAITNVNEAPTITGTPATTIAEDTVYRFQPTATDVDANTTLTYTIANKPTWATFNPATGELTGTPANGDVGQTTGIVIGVSDGVIATNLAPFDLTVTNVNDAPTIASTPATTIAKNSTYNFQPIGADVDANTTLTYTIINKPTWATFNAATGALTGTPTNANVGTTNGIVISVSDGTLTATLAAFDLVVTNINDAPTITGTPITTIAEDAIYRFQPIGADPDANTTLTYTIANKPTWATFNPATGALTGTPTNADVATTSGIVIGVSDGTITTNLAPFNLTVTNVNGLPQGNVSINGTPLGGQSLTASNTLTDSDGLGPIAYQWQQSIDGTNWTDITAATNATIALQPAQVGQKLRVKASYTDGQNTAESVFSTATATIGNITIPPVQPIFTIGGDVKVTANTTNKTLANWATDLTTSNPGSSYVVTTDRADLFTVLPTLDRTGTLTYTAKPGVKKNIQVGLTVQLKNAAGTIDPTSTKTATLTFRYQQEALVRNTVSQTVDLLYVDRVNQLQADRPVTYGSSFGAKAGQAAQLTPAWEIADTADFDADGIADVLLYSATGDEVKMWMMTDNGTIAAEQSFLGLDGTILRTGNPDWRVIGLADIDGDRTLDVVWHNPKSDEVGFWFMNADGKTVNRYDYLRQSDGAIYKTQNPLWQVADIADFDGDGDTDLLFRLPELNQTAIVRLQGQTVVDSQYITANADASLIIRGIGDANGDRIADIYWQTPDNRQVLVQPIQFQQGRWLSESFIAIASSAPLQGIGDLDRDGVDDLLLRDRANNGLSLTIVDATNPRPLGNLQNQGGQFSFDNSDWQIEQMDEFGELV
jgi:Domain of unknown function (DUF4347)/Cadherin-like/Putative Ig domain/WD40-like Beta Propeller Repeat